MRIDAFSLYVIMALSFLGLGYLWGFRSGAEWLWGLVQRDAIEGNERPDDPE